MVQWAVPGVVSSNVTIRLHRILALDITSLFGPEGETLFPCRQRSQREETSPNIRSLHEDLAIRSQSSRVLGHISDLEQVFRLVVELFLLLKASHSL